MLSSYRKMDCPSCPDIAGSGVGEGAPATDPACGGTADATGAVVAEATDRVARFGPGDCGSGVKEDALEAGAGDAADVAGWSGAVISDASTGAANGTVASAVVPSLDFDVDGGASPEVGPGPGGRVSPEVGSGPGGTTGAALALNSRFSGIGVAGLSFCSRDDHRAAVKRQSIVIRTARYYAWRLPFNAFACKPMLQPAIANTSPSTSSHALVAKPGTPTVA